MATFLLYIAMDSVNINNDDGNTYLNRTKTCLDKSSVEAGIIFLQVMIRK